MSTTRVTPIALRHETLPGRRRRRTVPMTQAPAAHLVRAQDLERALGVCGRDEGDEAALVGDVERIEAEQLAGRAHVLAHRDRALVERDRDARPSRRSRPARWPARRASGRAGSARRCPPRAAPAPARRAARSRSRSTVSKPSPSRAAMTAMPCRPISPLSSTTSPGRTLARRDRRLARRSRPMPAVLTNMPSALPRSTTLVSPVTSRTPAAARGRAHRGHDARERSPAAGLPRG